MARIALILSNSIYDHTNILINVFHDSCSIGAALERLGFKLVHGTNCNQSSTVRLLYDFSNLLHEGDEIFVYIAGHGFMHKGDSYFISIDAPFNRESLTELSSISLSTIISVLPAHSTRIIFFDACRNLMFSDNLSQNNAQIEYRQDKGTLGILYSSEAGCQSADDPHNLYSPFGLAVLHQLENPAANMTAFFESVSANVRKNTLLRQSPRYTIFGPLSQIRLDQPKGARTRKSSPPKLSASSRRRIGEAHSFLDASTGIDYVIIPPGEFVMGANLIDKLAAPHERPQRRVRILRSIAMAKYACTVGEWKKYVEAQPASTPNLTSQNGPVTDSARIPVTGITWYEAVQYTRWLNSLSIYPHRLPSEAEWEYACRAGRNLPIIKQGDTDPKLLFEPRSQHLAKITGVLPFPVDAMAANDWGIVGMLGNVWEWTLDDYQAGHETTSPNGTSVPPSDHKTRIIRGGDYLTQSITARPTARSWFAAGQPNPLIGFRVIVELPGGGSTS